MEPGLKFFNTVLEAKNLSRIGLVIVQLIEEFFLKEILQNKF